MVGLDNPLHLALLLVILLLIFGAKRLPEMGRSLGSGLRGFKESLSGETHATRDSEQPARELSAVADARASSEPASAQPVEAVKTRSAA